jgi:anti-sigma factor RsiW
MSFHLTDDQLVDRLYGVSNAGSEHLDVCPECQVRWSRMQLRRDLAVGSPHVSNQQLRQQRRQILHRLSLPLPAISMIWAPAAAAILLMVGLAITTPKANAPEPERISAEVVEAGWFEDTYSATRALEPRGASPIRQLFEEQGVPE